MKDHNFFLPATKDKPNRAQIWNDTFNDGFMVLWPVTTETFRDWAIHLFKVHEKDVSHWNFNITPGGGRMISHDGMKVLGLGMDNPSPGLIAHECFHWVNDMLSERKIPSSYKNDEIQAYLLTWAVDKTWEVINK